MTELGPSRHSLSGRLSFIYSTAMAVLAGLSLFWFVILLFMNWWVLAFTEGMLAIACVFTWLLIRRGRLSLALVVS